MDYVEGTLKIAQIPAQEILQMTSPALIYIVDRAVQNYRDLLASFRLRWPRTSIHFALKSCYSKPLVTALVRAGCGLEVMSELELQIAAQCGARRDTIVATGLGRSQAYIDALVEQSPKLIVIDCLADLTRFADAAGGGKLLDVALRVSASTDAKTYVTQGSKLGTDWSSGQFSELFRTAQSYPNLRIVGLHGHMLGRCADPQCYASAVRDIMTTAIAVRDAGIYFKYIDIGGGLDARFVIDQAGWHIDDFAHAASSELGVLGYEFELILEPGRFIAADAAVGLTTVLGEKSNSGQHFYIIDLSSNVLIPRPSMEYPVITLTDEGTSAQPVTFQVGDRTCTPAVFTASAQLPLGLTGQGLCVLNCGAYTTVFAELWAFSLPSMFVVESGQLTLILGHAQQQEFWKLLHGFDLTIDHKVTFDD